MTSQPIGSRPTEDLLASVRAVGASIAQAEMDRLVMIREWAVANTVTDEAQAATVFHGRVDTGLSLGGEGAPLVSEAALLELCACLGRSTDSGRAWVGKVIELAFRLPLLWDRVVAGEVPAWRALAVAERTLSLRADAAAHVDRHLAAFAATCTWAQVDRLVAEALVRFDPKTAEQQRRESAERRRFDIDTRQVSCDGTVHLEGELDLADGLDLEDAIARRAAALGRLGCDESLDVRRSMAAGEIARADLTLDLDQTGEAERAETSTPPRRGRRRVELIVHLSQGALEGVNPVSRCGATNSPVTTEQVKEWCGSTGMTDTTVIVRPVIDLPGHDRVDAYEIPDRHRRQVILRDEHCQFPWCQRRASRCDLDHARPYAQGGPTCPCNEVALCRRHHRAKTHLRWRYAIIDPGAYLWTSPVGYRYLVDHHGTRDLTHHPWPDCAQGDPPDG